MFMVMSNPPVCQIYVCTRVPLLKLKRDGTFLVERHQCNFVLFDKKEMHVYYFF